jgi:hypothetical protein
MKVPKIEPIMEPMNGALAYNSKRIPPRPNGNILEVSFLQGHGYFVLIT